jgi:predicted DNA-binding protein with PD1-like motif
MLRRRIDGGFAVVLRRGDPVHDCFVQLARDEDLRAAFVTGLGAFEDAVLAFYDIERKKYIETPVSGVLEVASLTGNITRVDGEPFAHLHAVVAGRDLVARAGHLVSARAGATLEAFVRDLGDDIVREFHDDIGLKLWQL